jgi:hypothetical protein
MALKIKGKKVLFKLKFPKKNLAENVSAENSTRN